MIKKFFALLGLLLCLSCEEEIEYSFNTISWSNSDFNECEYDSCPELSLNYIEFDSPEQLSSTVNTDQKAILIERLSFKGQKTSSIKEGVQQYLSNAQNAYPEASVYSGMHQLDINIEVGYASNQLLSLQGDFYEFAGGAHGIGVVKFWNYNPKTGQKLDNTTLFNDVEDFSAFAKAKFIQTHGSLDQFWFENGFTLPENIGFSKEGVILFYNVYEIAAYADGTFQLIFPWEEVEDYLSF